MKVRPLLSLTKEESKRRVKSLYRSCLREIPEILLKYDIPKNGPQLKAKMRDEFLKHSNVTDIRIIDMLLIKGQMSLTEIAKGHAQRPHVMHYFKDTSEPPKRKDFLSTFYNQS